MLPKSVPQCRHTKTNGLRCGSPAMRNHSFCYYHSSLRTHQRRASSAEAREQPIQLPPLEDAHAIQFAQTAFPTRRPDCSSICFRPQPSI